MADIGRNNVFLRFELLHHYLIMVAGIGLGRMAVQGEFMHRPLSLVLGVLVGLGAVSLASAADLPVKARPIVAPANPWTSCYLGGNVGGAWSTLDTWQASPAFATYGREKDTGFIGGGQIGCDFQTTNLVFGVQSSFDFGDVKGSHPLTDFPTFSENNSLKSIITATGRIGYLFTPTLLGYGKGGMAWLQDKNNILQPGGAPFQSANFWLPGMTAGGGLEWMFARDWSVFAEYAYYWIEDSAGKQFNPAPGFAGQVLTVKQTAQTAMVGVNYHFHWDGPVVAKY